MRSPFVAMLSCLSLGACCSSTTQPASPATADDTGAPTMSRPMTATVTPPVLAAAPGFIPNDLAALDAWLAERVANAKSGTRELVRVPVFKRADASTCACPPFALGRAHDAPHITIVLVDLTSIGTAAYAKDGALLWVEGRFVSADAPLAPAEGDARLPTLEVVRASLREPDETASLRVARPQP
jgi:hypothetical protein